MYVFINIRIYVYVFIYMCVRVCVFLSTQPPPCVYSWHRWHNCRSKLRTASWRPFRDQRRAVYRVNPSCVRVWCCSCHVSVCVVMICLPPQGTPP